MPDPIVHHDFTLEPADSERLANLAGPFDGHLRQIELRLGVEIANRGNVFRVSGGEDAVDSAERLLRTLYAEAGDTVFDSHAIHLRLNAANLDHVDDAGIRALALPEPAERLRQHRDQPDQEELLPRIHADAPD